MKWYKSLRKYFGFDRFVWVPKMVSSQSIVMESGYLPAGPIKFHDVPLSDAPSSASHCDTALTTSGYKNNSKFFSECQVYNTPDEMSDAETQTTPTTATAPAPATSSRVRTTVPLFFKAKLSPKGIRKNTKDGKVKRQAKSETQSFFCNTAIKESEISEELVKKLDLPVDPETSKKADAFVRLPGQDTSVKIEFVIVEGKGSKAYNLGFDALKRLRVVVDPSAGTDPTVIAERKAAKAEPAK
jgi:hypothetical protein